MHSGVVAGGFLDQSPIERDTSHRQIALGETCDESVNDGLRFVQHAGGDWSAVAIPGAEQVAIPHNAGLVRDVLDDRGATTKCVTAISFLNSIGYKRDTYQSFANLMSQLPIDQLVHIEDPDHVWQNRHLSGVKPIGIKLNSLPKVISRVENAFTFLPEGYEAYPGGALFLHPIDQERLLGFFEQVLTPKAEKPAPVRKPEPVKPAPILEAPAPVHAPPPNPDRHPIYYYEAKIMRVCSYLFTLMTGVMGEAAIERTLDNNPDISSTRFLGALGVACAIGAITSSRYRGE